MVVSCEGHSDTQRRYAWIVGDGRGQMSREWEALYGSRMRVRECPRHDAPDVRVMRQISAYLPGTRQYPSLSSQEQITGQSSATN